MKIPVYHSEQSTTNPFIHPFHSFHTIKTILIKYTSEILMLSRDVGIVNENHSKIVK